MARDVVLEAPCRLHFGLLDLGGATRRSFGGVGCFLEAPSTRVRLKSTPEPLCVGETTPNYLHKDVLAALRAFQTSHPHACGQVHIAESPLAHCGLGSKTSAVLGALTCAAIANGIEVDPEALKVLSRRGGASGVGIHGFFEGGLIVDCGHDARPTGPWLPSGAYANESLPLKILRLTLPQAWKVHLMLPNGKAFRGCEESEFFRRVTPLDQNEVLRAVASVWHGIVPAFVKGDYDLLRLAFADMCNSGLKKKEIESQPASRDLINAIQELGLPVSMSSMGPLVFAISHGVPAAASELKECCQQLGAEYIAETSFTNHGYLAEFT